jgi:MOSC domain-containing protein YiiM
VNEGELDIALTDRVPPETCAGCGFDAADYTHEDLLGTLRALAPIWRTTTEGIAAPVLATRPARGVWSAVEYAAHSRDVTAAMGYLLKRALTEDHPILDAPPPQTPQPETPARLLDAVTELDQHVARVQALSSRMGDDGWLRPITLGEDTVDVGWILGHAVHDATHHLHDVGRGLHTLGAGAPRQRGTLVRVSASRGGVPKSELATATIRRRGVLGDHQAERRHHGRAFRALSLWSREVIEALRADGHSVYPGAAGENLTVSGIDWSTIRPGVRLSIGEVQAEISAFATPCAKNAQWFSDGNFRRIEHDLHPGTSRAYAWVLGGGEVSPGDEVVVEP